MEFFRGLLDIAARAEPEEQRGAWFGDRRLQAERTPLDDDDEVPVETASELEVAPAIAAVGEEEAVVASPQASIEQEASAGKAVAPDDEPEVDRHGGRAEL